MHLAGLQYALTCTIGIFVARTMYRSDRDAAWLVLVPAGFSVVGGVYIHLTEMAVLIPLAVMFACRQKSPLALAVLAMFAIPLETAVPFAVYLPAAALTAALLLREARAHVSIFVAVSLAIIGVGSGLHDAFVAQLSSHPVAILDAGPNALASSTWETFSSLTPAYPMWWLFKASTIAPAVAFAGLMASYAFGRRAPLSVDRTAATQSWLVAPGAV